MPRKRPVSKTKILLPAHVTPERYELMVKPDLEGFTFEGEETIFLIVKKSSREITLHAKDLKIQSAEFRHSSLPLPLRPAQITYDAKAETATFLFSKPIAKGRGQLRLSFTGIIIDGMRGFYRSQYAVRGTKKYLATTQFEPTDARRAFPCFDEPAHKAIFDITLMVPARLTAISNTIERAVDEHESGYKIVKFEPTPKMSTYLLAFIVGEFEYIEGKTKRGVLVRVFTTPGKKEHGRFALEVAIKCLDFYERYFDINYPLPALDLVAIPDFEAAAMENWGAITYRESAILFDPGNSSAGNKQWVATVIAHELAHQWFGNLVTMHWWTDLWLNEGFAAYMENWVLEQLYPEWEIEKQVVTGRLSEALHLDSLKTTHPIEVEVGHPDEIDEIFDSISYAKGASVIRMLANYLGEKTFRDGLRHYLKKHQYGNALTTDLWRAFEYVSGKPVGHIMKIWTRREGYPVVSVREAGGDGKITSLEFTQERFFSSAISRQQARDRTVWPVPFKITAGKKSGPGFFLDKKSGRLKMHPAVMTVKINAGETSLMRARYSPRLMELLRQAITRKLLDPIDRIGAVRDAFALVAARMAPVTDALELAAACRREDDYAVWSELIGGLLEIYRLGAFQPWRKQYENFCLGALADIAKMTGWERRRGERHTRGLLRSLVISAGGTFGDKKIIVRARRLFAGARRGRPVPADIRAAVYGVAAENGGKKEFLRFLDMYRKTGLHEEQDRINRALSKFRDPAIQREILRFSLGSEMRRQDAPFLWARMLANPYARNEAWRFIKKQWPWLVKQYGTSRLLGRIAAYTEHFCTQRDYSDVKEFFASHPVPAGKRSVEQALEQIAANVDRLRRDGRAIGEWLQRVES